jgi:hypothetical protein
VTLRLLCAAFALISFLAGCGTQGSLSAGLQVRAGAEALFCGYVAPGADASSADSCALDAYDRGIPFWVRYGRCGDDPASETIFMRAADGRLLLLRFEADPAVRSSRYGPKLRLVESACQPVIVMIAPGHHRLTCVDDADGRRLGRSPARRGSPRAPRKTLRDRGGHPVSPRLGGGAAAVPPPRPFQAV